MKTAIYATLFHSISTDQKPQHFKCLTGKDSWCFFQAAIARGEVPGPHVKHVKTPLKETHLAKIPGHVGILGNEQADTAARSMSDLMQRPVCYQDLKPFTQHYIHRVWQETWDQEILDKLHNIHPSTSHWAALPVRKHDVRLTLLRIGHTRFTHRHLLLGENAPECLSCKVPYSVYHILIDWPVFNHHRITFHTSVLTITDFIWKDMTTECPTLLLEKSRKQASAVETVASLAADYVFGRKNRLFVTDKIVGYKFLVHSGADVSIIPVSKDQSQVSDYTLYAANTSEMPNYGIKMFILELRFR
ncbi:RNase H domain-containing protein [Trichonephila clavipes]|nr:RNase H domain-containing protein [Trichonephila clavipes]